MARLEPVAWMRTAKTRVVASRRVTTRKLFKSDIPLYTLTPEQLAWLEKMPKEEGKKEVGDAD